jgi:hypothetical protein
MNYLSEGIWFLGGLGALIPALSGVGLPSTSVAAEVPHQQISVDPGRAIAPGETMRLPVHVENTYGQPLGLYLASLQGTPGLDAYTLAFADQQTVDGTGDFLGCLPLSGRELTLEISLDATAGNEYLGVTYNYNFELRVQTDARCS